MMGSLTAQLCFSRVGGKTKTLVGISRSGT